jgi:hypothetical protein
MTNKQLLKQAIIAHFACDKVNMKCSSTLEDSVDAAQAFFVHLSGTESQLFKSLIEKSRYRVKLELINRYIKNNETTN